jgi:predicted nucleotidyltransferase
MKAFRNFKIKSSSKQIMNHIQDLCRQIVRAVNPQQIILFGSYAYGQPNEDSDVDLLIVMPFEGHPAYQAAAIRMQLDTPLPLDLLVRTPEQIAERIGMGDYFMQEVMAQGRVLYEANHAGVDKQGRKRLGKRAA